MALLQRLSENMNTKMDIKLYKDKLRKEIKEKRILMSREDVQNKSEIICQKIINSDI